MKSLPRLPVVLALVVAGLVAGLWIVLGRPEPMPPSPLAQGEKLPCVSYAPFRDGQSPFQEDLIIPEAQLEDDLARLSKITACIRTYSIEAGLDRVPALARKYGLSVLQGIWVGYDPVRNKKELEAGIKVVKENPDVVKGVIVGNEVLLRGEMSPMELSETIRQVKAEVGNIPVTYADVWEFWERNKGLAADVDFVTIHILPYWEDLPVSAADAGPHVDEIRQHMAEAFPGKEILIGETGWPSAGRMREEALPSPSNQALVMHDILGLAKRQGYRVNVIEAFDQPWKRQLEGTVGGHWGLLDARSRTPKFAWGEPVADFPAWRANIVAGVLAVFAAFGAALAGARARQEGERELDLSSWLGVSVMAFAGAATLGAAFTNLGLESFNLVGWLRNGAFFALALASVVAWPWLLGRGQGLAPLSILFDPKRRAASPPAARLSALMLALTLVAAGMAALELVFNPRYKDFPDFVLTGPVVGALVLAFLCRPERAGASQAEQLGLFGLALAGLYVPLNETLTNGQALWFGLICLALALTLWRVRAVRRTA